ncbi:MAG: hypothetical protein ACRD0K_27325 [Egibacteraceae bacterium]
MAPAAGCRVRVHDEERSEVRIHVVVTLDRGNRAVLLLPPSAL